MMLQSVDEDEKVKVNNVYFENRTGGNGINIKLWDLEPRIVYKCFDGLSVNILLSYLEVAKGLCEN